MSTKTILVVDDSATLRHMALSTLERAGFAVVEANDGVEGLARLAEQRVHLVISDVNMPNMDGLAFIGAVRELPHYRFTPIIMLTAESAEAMRQKAREANIRAWLHKPFQPAQILAAVSKLLVH